MSTTFSLSTRYDDPVAQRDARLVRLLSAAARALGRLVAGAAAPRPTVRVADLSPRTLEDIGATPVDRAESEMMAAYARWHAEVRQLRGL